MRVDQLTERQQRIRRARLSQSIEELARKERRAARRGHFTQEGIDLAHKTAAVITYQLRTE